MNLKEKIRQILVENMGVIKDIDLVDFVSEHFYPDRKGQSKTGLLIDVHRQINEMDDIGKMQYHESFDNKSNMFFIYIKMRDNKNVSQ